MAQEKVHQEEEERPFEGMVRLHHEEPEEHGVVEGRKTVRHEEPGLDMTQHYQHEPSEGDAGVHVAQQRLAFPYLGVQEDIADDVLEVYYP